MRASHICPLCGSELAIVRGEWCDVVSRQVVKCGCGYAVARGIARRKQVREVMQPYFAAVLLVASVVVWVVGAGVCASGALLMCLEFFSVMNYGGTLSAWSSVALLGILSGAGAAVVGAWTGLIRKDGVTLKRWGVFAALTCVAMLWALLTTTAIGDLVSGRGVSAVRNFVWLAALAMSGVCWLGGAVGLLVRWVVGSTRDMLWRRMLNAARQMRPERWSARESERERSV